LNPGYFCVAQAYAGPERPTNYPIDAKINLIIGQNTRIASRVKAVACHVLVIQVEQIGVFEYFVEASIIGYFDALVAYKQCYVIVGLE
jgi:hypothetical protein